MGRVHGEVQVLADLVHRAEVAQPLHVAHDRRDRLDRADVVVRRQDPQRRHVVAVQGRLAVGDGPPVLTGGHRPLEQGVVDVGDVLDVVDLVAAVAPDPVHQVEGHVGRGVAHVGGVVRGDAAHVHPGDGTRRGGPQLTRGAVVQPQRQPAPGQRGYGGRWPGRTLVTLSARGLRRRARAAAASPPPGTGTRPGRAAGAPGPPCGAPPGGPATPQAPAQGAVEGGVEPVQVVDEDGVERVAGPAPEHRAQLVVLMEGDPVVDAPARPCPPPGRARPCGRRCSRPRRRPPSPAAPGCRRGPGSPAGRRAPRRRPRRATRWAPRRGPPRRPGRRSGPRRSRPGTSRARRALVPPHGRGHQVPAGRGGHVVARRPRGGPGCRSVKSHSGRSPARGL